MVPQPSGPPQANPNSMEDKSTRGLGVLRAEGEPRAGPPFPVIPGVTCRNRNRRARPWGDMQSSGGLVPPPHSTETPRPRVGSGAVSPSLGSPNVPAPVPLCRTHAPEATGWLPFQDYVREKQAQTLLCSKCREAETKVLQAAPHCGLEPGICSKAILEMAPAQIPSQPKPTLIATLLPQRPLPPPPHPWTGLRFQVHYKYYRFVNGRNN